MDRACHGLRKAVAGSAVDRDRAQPDRVREDTEDDVRAELQTQELQPHLQHLERGAAEQEVRVLGRAEAIEGRGRGTEEGRGEVHGAADGPQVISMQTILRRFIDYERSLLFFDGIYEPYAL